MDDGVMGVAMDSLFKIEITSLELLLYMECREVLVGAGAKMNAEEGKFTPEMLDRLSRMEEICQAIYKKMGEQEKRKMEDPDDIEDMDDWDDDWEDD